MEQTSLLELAQFVTLFCLGAAGLQACCHSGACYHGDRKASADGDVQRDWCRPRYSSTVVVRSRGAGGKALSRVMWRLPSWTLKLICEVFPFSSSRPSTRCACWAAPGRMKLPSEQSGQVSWGSRWRSSHWWWTAGLFYLTVLEWRHPAVGSWNFS